jgi:tagatose 6-phosphate kinase
LASARLRQGDSTESPFFCAVLGFCQGEFSGKVIGGMILCIGTTPAAQRVMMLRRLEIDAVNRATATLDGAAGKSINVAKVLAVLGAHPMAMGFAGGERGTELLRDLASRNIEADFVSVPAATRQCISVLDQANGTVTELVEESKPVPPENYDALMALIRRRLPGCSAVVLSGSLTPGGPVSFYREVVEWAATLGIRTIVDAQGPPLMEALKAHPTLVKPNRQELAATVEHPLVTEAQVLEAMQEVSRRGAAQIVVTAGKLPVLAMDGQRAWRVPAPRIAAVNPIGSGDAFTAGLVWRLTLQEELGEACRWAAAAGAANALSAMPGELDPRDVERLAHEVKVETV